MLKHNIGGMKLAVALATAWGCPDRWHELLADKARQKASQANYGVLPHVSTQKAKGPRKRAS